MSIQVELTNASGTLDYFIPEYNDVGWAQGNGNLTDYLVALATATLQVGSGSFPLTTPLNLGPNFGIIVPSITSSSTNPATAGVISLANTDLIDFRNNANSANLALGVNSSDQLTFNGTPIGATTSLADGKFLIGNASNLPVANFLSGDITSTDTGVITIANSAITNAKVSSSAAIATTKLAALSASIVPVSDSSGFLTSSTTTVTQLGYLDATSSIQTQLNAKLSLSGGTLSGNLNMASYKIISLANGTASGDALAWGQKFTSSDITVNGTITFAGSGTIGIVGTTTNNSAAAGSVGEYVLSNVVSGSAVTIASSGVYINITSISLTAGDWDIVGAGTITDSVAGTPTGNAEIVVSLYSANTTTDHVLGLNDFRGAPSATYDCSIAVPLYRLSVASTTTVYLKSTVGFSSGTWEAYGSIQARRRR